MEEKIMSPRRVLLMYATMTKNTEKVATWFKEVFEEYGWEVIFLRILNRMNWAELQPKLYFDDYDLICLGSPIVGGQALQAIIKAFSFGAGGALEKQVQDKLDSKEEDAAAPPFAADTAEWRRGRAPSPGMADHTTPRKHGLVFTTYGGGFYGTEECKVTLEQLRSYLMLRNVDVIGRFACPGRETGPAGYDLGVKPKAVFIPGKKGADAPDADVCDAVKYRMGDGTLVPGSYFMHFNCNAKPGDRERAKARAFIADVIEDYFMTYDGVPNPPISEIVSMS